MRVKHIFLFLFAVLLISACKYHQMGMISSKFIGPEYKYTDIATGVSEARYLWGFGGAKKDALVLRAKKNMALNRPLNSNETYGDITIDYQYHLYLFVEKLRVVVSADVVQLAEKGDTTKYSASYKEKVGFKKLVNELFSIGDTVVNELNEKYKISGFRSEKVVFIEKLSTDYFNSNIKSRSIDRIFTWQHSFKGFSPNSRVRIDLGGNGTIVALGTKMALVRLDKSGEISIEAYRSLQLLKQ